MTGRRGALLRLGGLMALPLLPRQTLARGGFALVAPGRTLRFPQDEGSHPAFRTEWWYVTGWLDAAGGKTVGFQITFFRSRPALKQDNPSAFAPHHILLAHAAISDPEIGRLLHDQRIARAGFGLAAAEAGKTAVWVDDWSLAQEGKTYRAAIAAGDFRLDLVFAATQPPLLNGRSGYSQKGPSPQSASYYYSLPHLKVTGELGRAGKRERIAGTAWLDHEWSSQYVDRGAVGWDWLGINLDDGGALMLFRMRDAQGGATWAGGTYRADGVTQTFPPREVEFVPQRTWRSPRTSTVYPVAWRVRAGRLELSLEPLIDDQENDTRLSTGTIYWEGAVRVLSEGKPAGRGYLELTGYWKPLKL